MQPIASNDIKQSSETKLQLGGIKSLHKLADRNEMTATGELTNFMGTSLVGTN